MTWNATAVAVGIHALGAVEASMDYGAINTVDPISIGLFQWYGTRAAGLLQRIKTQNPSLWASAPSTLQSDLIAHSPDDTWWNSRLLTSTERSGLSPVLTSAKSIQDVLAGEDMDGYKDTAVRNGMNASTNTQSVLFFANMYNQSPVAALRVLRAATINTTLLNLLNKCLADSTLGAYSSRYNTAYTIINSMDPGTVTVGTTDPATPSDPTPTTEPSDNPVKRVELQASQLVVYLGTGSTVTCYPATNGMYLPRDAGVQKPTEPVPPTPTPPPPDPGETVPAAIDDYPYASKPIGVASPFLFYYRECVDFCAWRIRTRTDLTNFTNYFRGVRWGNANNWNNAAAQAGVRVDQTPDERCIAYSERGTFGHVAFVRKLGSGGTFYIEEYNYAVNHGYGKRQCDMSDFDGFIHFEDE